MSQYKQLVHHILTHAASFGWSLQGFGMLRLNLGNDVRLHVWDSRFAVPDVSVLHDHPLDLHSEIIAGVMVNRRFHHLAKGEPTHEVMTIRPGVGLQQLSRPTLTRFAEARTGTFRQGEAYWEHQGDFHISEPQDGTVTLVQRHRKGDDVARVAWPIGKSFVSAEPRVATVDEVLAITSASLKRWF